MGWYNFGPYISVAQKKARAEKLILKLKKTQPDLQPVCLAGRSISQSFWGKAWCKHLETYADHENRIGRGRSYVRNSAVCHLAASFGRLDATVAGSHGEPYQVTVTVKPLPASRWKAIKDASVGRIGSMLDLLSGKFPKDIMAQVADPNNGLFPKLGELKFSCTCPDWAQMCKHVAAALYAFGHRLDLAPELLFLLRGVEPAELVNLENLVGAATAGAKSSLGDDCLADIFGIELDLGGSEKADPKSGRLVRKKGKGAPCGLAGARAQAAIEPAGPRRTKKQAMPDIKPAFKNPNRPKGREIAALRRKLMMNMTEFAAALGVSPLTVSRWEKLTAPELRTSSKEKLIALARKM